MSSTVLHRAHLLQLKRGTKPGRFSKTKHIERNMTASGRKSWSQLFWLTSAVAPETSFIEPPVSSLNSMLMLTEMVLPLVEKVRQCMRRQRWSEQKLRRSGLGQAGFGEVPSCSRCLFERPLGHRNESRHATISRVAASVEVWKLLLMTTACTTTGRCALLP